MSEIRLGAYIGRIRRALVREFDARSSALEITMPQFHVLRCLWRQDGVLTSALAGEAVVDGATLTGVLDRLEARGLIRRERSREDRRAVRIHLTPSGRDLERPLRSISAAVNDLALEGLNPQEREELVALLARVARNLNVCPPEPPAPS
jgi:MarR family transcriptional regulator, organic hydroperoxide resistance regulator